MATLEELQAEFAAATACILDTNASIDDQRRATETMAKLAPLIGEGIHTESNTQHADLIARLMDGS